MANITKTDLVKNVAQKTEMSKKDVAIVLDGLTEEIMSEVAKKNKVQLIGFGTFEAHHRNARKGRNPQNGEEIEIPATEVPVFKAGKEFKESVKN
ncbi:MAG: HU family DNA-binding protein [Lactobacillus crispatus]|nr:HU family DNA-binding protein [Lactobacillus crispatus]